MTNENYPNVLEEFHQKATSTGLEYMMIGGFAASYWGKPRFTADVDYVILVDSFEKAKQVLTALDYELVFLHPKKSFAHFAKKRTSSFKN